MIKDVLVMKKYLVSSLLLCMSLVCGCSDSLGSKQQTMIEQQENKMEATENRIISYSDIVGQYEYNANYENKYKLYLYDNGLFIYEKNELCDLSKGKNGYYDGVLFGNYIIDNNKLYLNTIFHSDVAAGDMFSFDISATEKKIIIEVIEDSKLKDTNIYEGEDESRIFSLITNEQHHDLLISLIEERYLVNTKWINNIGYK